MNTIGGQSALRDRTYRIFSVRDRPLRCRPSIPLWQPRTGWGARWLDPTALVPSDGRYKSIAPKDAIRPLIRRHVFGASLMVSGCRTGYGPKDKPDRLFVISELSEELVVRDAR
jgi:hypothetical protein